MSTSQVSVSLSNGTIKKLDSLRGLTKRSTIIEKILSDYLEKEGFVPRPQEQTPKAKSKPIRPLRRDS